MKIRYMLLHAYGMGGTIRTVINQAGAMAEAGHDVEIISVVRRRRQPRFDVDPRVRLTALVDQRRGATADSVARKAWRRVRGRIVPRGEPAAGYFTERVEKAVIDCVSALDDGVLVTTRPALNLISARRTPRSVVRVAQEHMNLGTHREPVRRQIARHYGKLDAVVVLTGTDRADYQRLLPDTPVVRIPNAVGTLGRRLSSHDNRVVAAAGRLVAQKGFDLLIPAFGKVVREHRDWRLRIYGTGQKQDELHALIEEHGLRENVALMGQSDRLGEELAQASLYALSSRFEGLPMVMIEAMSHALPVVAFDCPTGPADVLTHGIDGLLVPPGDVDAFAEALGRLVADRELRGRMGAAALETVRGYAPDRVMPMWERLFAGLMSGQREI
ncbi:glycosyltransferase family 4 protein [Planomonospora sp. ID67723]|uniref:glycosyltransferase family 4 protein n=1 Tax=Planomonospora sp. ID67723 TaxID=2738134 RepID=UPI0018C35638|nr:glycosyltransferase family 4 protein [Planomonospora sp. ID67723]MBG0827002.1 glycosyltransferase family 4 protein [Planomonospora sp. ID67723]